MADLEGHLGADAFAIFEKRFREALEYIVDGLADAIAPLMPTMAQFLEGQQ